MRRVSCTSCVRCGSRDVKRNGRVRGWQRWLCSSCGRTFGDRTGTVLNSSKLPAGKLKDMMRMLEEGVMTHQIANILGLSVNTVVLWKRKLQALAKSQENTRLSGDVWVDYTYVRAPSLDRTAGSKRGISGRLLRIAVACDSSGRHLAFMSGRGAARDRDILRDFSGRIEPGSSVYHDMEFNSWQFLGCYSMPVRSTAPEAHAVMNPVDRLCAEVKRMLSVHARIKRHNLQRWLDELIDRIETGRDSGYPARLARINREIFSSGKTLVRRRIFEGLSLQWLFQ